MPFDDVEIGRVLVRLLDGDSWVLLRTSPAGEVTMMSNAVDEKYIIDWLRVHADALEEKSYDSFTVHDARHQT